MDAPALTEQEVRLRCIEAAARFPQVHPDGPARGVLEAASLWFHWIISKEKDEGVFGKVREILHLPKRN